MNQKIETTTMYQKVLKKAKEIAISEGSSTIDRKHLFFAIISIKPNLFNRLFGVKLTLPVLNTSEKKTASSKKTNFSSDAYRVLSPNRGVMSLVLKYICTVDIDIIHIAAALTLDNDPNSPIQELLAMNGLSYLDVKQRVIENIKKIALDGAKDTEELAHKNANIIKKALKRKIVGQDEAIDNICMELFNFWSTPIELHTKPLFITLCGEQGTGKQTIAQILIDEISKLNGVEPIKALEAGLYSTTDTSRDINGLNSTWKGGPKPGDATKPIKDNPFGVLLINNIEELHQIALNLLIEICKKGFLFDNGMEEEVDFRNAIVICTTSAGCSKINTFVSKTRLAEEISAALEEDSSKAKIVKMVIEESTQVIFLNRLNIEKLRDYIEKCLVKKFNTMYKLNRKIAFKINHRMFTRLADFFIQTIESDDPRDINCFIENLVKQIHSFIFNNYNKINSLKIDLEGAPQLDLNLVHKYLHMRKRLTYNTNFNIQNTEGLLTISAGKYCLLPAVKDGLIQIVPPKDCDTFDNLVGLDQAQKRTMAWNNYFTSNSELKPEFPILCGPPGCGKTSFVRAWASVLSLPYVVLNCNDLKSSKDIISVFSTIKKYSKEGCLVFFDEIDSIAGKRNSLKSEWYIERVNTLFQQLDGFNQDKSAKVLYIAATNRLDTLDEALLRPGRFGLTIMFTDLNDNEREKLIQIVAKQVKIQISKDLIKFIVQTTRVNSPAEIKAIICEMKHIVGFKVENASKATYIKARENIISGICTQTQTPTPEEENTTATHESGHAIIAALYGRKIVQATINPSFSSLGFVECYGLNNIHTTEKGMKESIHICLAGRAAEEIILGYATDGSNSDIEKAEKIVKHYIITGHYKDYGLGTPSENLMFKMTTKILNQEYEFVKKQVLKNKQKIIHLSNLLLKEKTIYFEEIRKVLKTH